MEIEISFLINEFSILTVRASENSQGLQNELIIINDKGYQKDEIKKNDNKIYSILVDGNKKSLKIIN